ncbi:unnamed protein product [Gadus morhua 'NCC']
MAGRKTSQRTSSNFEISDSDDDDDNEEISKVIRNLDAKIQEKESREPALQWRKRDQFGRLIGKSHGSSKMYSSTRQTQSSNIGEEHVEDSTGPLTSELQETHNMIDLHIQELQQMLDAVGEDVAGGSTEASSSSSQTWSVRQALSGERWRNARPQLLEAMLEAGRVPKGFCQLCHVKEAVISCTDCLQKHMLCSQCDITLHRQYSLHNRSSVVGSSHRALPPTDIFVHDASGEPTLGEEVRLLPFALPKSICSKAENVSVVGKKLSWST